MATFPKRRFEQLQRRGAVLDGGIFVILVNSERRHLLLHSIDLCSGDGREPSIFRAVLSAERDGKVLGPEPTKRVQLRMVLLRKVRVRLSD